MNLENLTAKNAKGAKEELLFKVECDAIQGAIFDVYRDMPILILHSHHLEKA